MKTPKSRIEFNHDRRELFVEGKSVHLPNAEYRVLHALKSTNRAMTREELGHEVGHTPEQIENGGRVIDQYVARLRRKLGRHADAIETVSRFGYRIASAYA